MPVKRRHFLKGSGIAAVSAMAGCLGGGDGDDGGDGNGDGNGDDMSDGSGDDGGSDSDGGTTDMSGETIRIGHILPIGLPNAEPIQQAAEYVVNVELENELLGADVEYVTAESELTPEGAANAATQLVDSDDVDVLTGGFASEWSLSVQQRLSGNQDIIYFGLGAAPEHNQRVAEAPDQFGFYFSLMPRSEQSDIMTAQNMEDDTLAALDGSHAVLLAEEIASTENAADNFRSATRDDVTIDEVRISPGTEDFSTALSNIEDTDADLLVSLLAVSDIAGFISQWASRETPLPLDGFTLPADNNTFPDQVGADAAHSVATNTTGFNAPITENTLDFYEGYVEEFGNSPSFFGWHQGDALRAWVNAVRNTGTLDQDALIEELEQINFAGTMGQIQFQGTDGTYPHGPVIDREDGIWYTHTQWQRVDGELQRVMLGPDQWADHDGEQSFVIPDWI